MFMLIALLVPILAACGGDDDDDDSTPAPTTAATSPAAGGDATATTAEPEETEAETEATATEAEAEASPTEEEADATATEDEAAASPTGGSTGEGTVVEGGDLTMGMTMEEGTEGGVLIEGSFSDISTTNPVMIADTPSSDFLAGVFETLMTADPNTLEPVGLLAESWEINEDATVWTIHLREGVMWQDGEPFTAADVEFTYNLHMNEAVGSSYTADISSKIESMEVVDDLTIVFNLTQTLVDFPLDLGVYGIVPMHIWEDVDPAAVAADPGSTGQDPARVVGTGPFKFVEWVIEDHATLERAEGYWGTHDAYLDQFIYKVVPDQAAGVAQLQTGEIDYMEGVPESAITEFEGNPDVTISDVPTLNFTFYGLQLDPEKSPLFQDVEVRQALLYALDREAMIESIRFGYGEVAVGTMPTLTWAYNPDGIEMKYPYDPEMAVSLLEQAGWTDTNGDGTVDKDGNELAFTMITNAGNQVREAYLTALQEFWAQIGVAMTPQLEPFPALVERITDTFDFEAVLIGFSWSVPPDQTTMFGCDGRDGAGFNFSDYCNEEVDALLNEALTETDQATRAEIYTEYQNIVAEELPMTILDFPVSIIGVNNRVHNLFPSSVNARFNMHEWWVEE